MSQREPRGNVPVGSTKRAKCPAKGKRPCWHKGGEKMKKVLAVILSAALAFSMAACGGKKDDGAADAPDVKGEGVMTYEE